MRPGVVRDHNRATFVFAVGDTREILKEQVMPELCSAQRLSTSQEPGCSLAHIVVEFDETGTGVALTRAAENPEVTARQVYRSDLSRLISHPRNPQSAASTEP